jgi:hypothetical protein
MALDNNSQGTATLAPAMAESLRNCLLDNINNLLFYANLSEPGPGCTIEKQLKRSYSPPIFSQENSNSPVNRLTMLDVAGRGGIVYIKFA